MSVLSANLLRTIGTMNVIENTVSNFAVCLSLAMLFRGFFILSLFCCCCFFVVFFFSLLILFYFCSFFFLSGYNAALRKTNIVVCFVLHSSHAWPNIGFVFISSSTCTCISARNDDSQMSELSNCGLIHTVSMTLLFTSY